ncbi:MAG: GNAT family N-acetyltransferase [Chloroflexi bacterium]|nr:MAG: GNAT family N-acetyltransferase [Chloroflexota bacterium]MBL1195250.1 GNAT family N-acetyltransferase [Chloroflexota bacterium]NOH12536.1 GNAT family N-acetyltransferase [Chloroflexota bacterium]
MTEKTLDKQYIEINDTPQVEGLAFRKFRGEADYPEMVELVNAANRFDEVDEQDNLEDFSHSYNNLKNCDPDKDILIAEVDGQMAAYARVWWRDIKDDGRVYYTYGRVHPDYRRQGIGTAMLKHNEARVKTIAAEHAYDGPRSLDSWYADTETGTIAMLEKFGYKPQRYFFEMTRDLSQPIEERPMPEGIETRPSTKEQYRQIWDGLEEAFRDHWGHPEDFGDDDFKRWAEHPRHKPELWKVGWEGDEVAGMVLNEVFEEENKLLGRLWGWTDPICVRRPWRKRGLAKALITESLVLFKDMGMSHAALGVDTQNPLGALGLYESLGFKTVKEWLSVRKPMD